MPLPCAQAIQAVRCRSVPPLLHSIRAAVPMRGRPLKQRVHAKCQSITQRKPPTQFSASPWAAQLHPWLIASWHRLHFGPLISYNAPFRIAACAAHHAAELTTRLIAQVSGARRSAPPPTQSTPCCRTQSTHPPRPPSAACSPATPKTRSAYSTCTTPTATGASRPRRCARASRRGASASTPTCLGSS